MTAAPDADPSVAAHATPGRPPHAEPRTGGWEIETASGSRYRLRLDREGRWWLSADNRPNPFSVSLADGEWEIQPPAPWPPVLGARCWFEAPAYLRLGDPRRVPGGGKVTSAVAAVRALRSPSASTLDQEDKP